MPSPFQGEGQTVEKVAKPLFRVGLHEISASISCEIVGLNFVRGVISEAHVLGNDEIRFYSVVCGRRNSLQEGFFDKLAFAFSPPGGRLTHVDPSEERLNGKTRLNRTRTL